MHVLTKRVVLLLYIHRHKCLCDIYGGLLVQKMPHELLCLVFSAEISKLRIGNQWFEIELAHLLLGHFIWETFNKAVSIVRAFELIEGRWGKLNFKLRII